MTEDRLRPSSTQLTLGNAEQRAYFDKIRQGIDETSSKPSLAFQYFSKLGREMPCTFMVYIDCDQYAVLSPFPVFSTQPFPWTFCEFGHHVNRAFARNVENLTVPDNLTSLHIHDETSGNIHCPV